MFTNFNNFFTIAFSDELRKSICKIYHLISNLLPHYIAKVVKLNVQFGNFTARYSMQMWRRIVYLQYLSTGDAKFCFLCLYGLICNSKTRVKIFCL